MHIQTVAVTLFMKIQWWNLHQNDGTDLPFPSVSLHFLYNHPFGLYVWFCTGYFQPKMVELTHFSPFLLRENCTFFNVQYVWNDNRWKDTYKRKNAVFAMDLFRFFICCFAKTSFSLWNWRRKTADKVIFSKFFRFSANFRVFPPL